MSWSDDIRCLYCDGRLPLYRKITHGQFCSTAHRKAYWQEQERLAVERLHQTHSTLKAVMPPPALPAEAILGPAAQPKTELSGFVPNPVIYPQAQGAPWMLAADPLIYDMELNPGKLEWHASANEVRCLPCAPIVHLIPVWFSSRSAPSAVRTRGGELSPRPVSMAPVQSLGSGLAAIQAEEPALAPVSEIPAEVPVEVPIPDPPSAAPVKLALTIPESPIALPAPREEVSSRMPRPTLGVKLALAPVTPELEAPPQPDAPLFAEALQPLQQFQPCDAQFALKRSVEPVDSTIAVAAYPISAYSGHSFSATPQLAAMAGRVAMPAPRAAQDIRLSAEPRTVASALTPAPAQPQLSLPMRQPRLAMGRGSRYPVQYRQAAPVQPQTGAMDFPKLPADVMLPASKVDADPNALLDAIVPPPARMLSLSAAMKRVATERTATKKKIVPLVLDISTIPQPLQTQYLLPVSKLEPIEAPVSSEFQPEPVAPGTAPLFAGVVAKEHVWTHAANFWKVAPRDLKLLVFAIPVLLALAFHRQLPKVHVTGPSVSTTQIRKNLVNVVNTQLTSARQAVVGRAGVALDDDFRSGLDDWASRGDSTAEWSFDTTGFVKPGPLALYRPSMNLTDFQFQFLGMIDKKALSWVVRATDFDNYYVVKLEVLKPGPRSTIGITRYAVINGKAENRVDTPVEIETQPDTLYRVGMDLDGENFSLLIQGQMADTWSEPRLKHGGVGFFTAKGEESRIRWVSVRHQYDMLGRLCAYLAPYESSNGNW